MLRQFLNWRTLLALLAILIVTGTIFYSQYLAKKIEREERQKVEQWVEASKSLLDTNITDTRLPSKIIIDNDDIPIIVTDENDNILDFVNLDSVKVAHDKSYVQRKLSDFRSSGRKPFIYVDPYDSSKVTRYYYGHTRLLNEVRYYPIIQLCIVALFIVIILLSLRSSYRSVQNQLWAGMAKETAHQLGTPVSSLEGWVEMLKETESDTKIVHELEKDVDRLRLVSDRFGKIGSTPQLEKVNIVEQINGMVDYMRKRAAGKISFKVNTNGLAVISADVSPPLFDWVIENLLKNSLDAMEGKGSIVVDIQEDTKNILIDVTDTGKGISKQNIASVFKPGFTTKKRGWGLGLSLSRRIISTYHKGEIFIKHSELGKGTTFRIVLKK
ncbi:MAG: HAMP domain-containing histidine kinase [Chitinophagaceae bacterium]|nr:HAMP domain-containing histidine kinase [Chitinophagaceae bacterium]MCB9055917.1 HAMP domain-containing histidine kinase [Chitinophagales bacterium]